MTKKTPKSNESKSAFSKTQNETDDEFNLKLSLRILVLQTEIDRLNWIDMLYETLPEDKIPEQIQLLQLEIDDLKGKFRHVEQ